MPITLQAIAMLLLPRPRTGELLSESERRTLAAAAEVLLEGVAFPISAGEVTSNVERFIGAPSSRRAWRVRVLLTLVELAPPLLLGRRPFSRLSREERARLIRERLVAGRGVWGLCARVRPLVYLGAYASPAARRHVGWIEVPERERFVRSEAVASEGVRSRSLPLAEVQS